MPDARAIFAEPAVGARVGDSSVVAGGTDFKTGTSAGVGVGSAGAALACGSSVTLWAWASSGSCWALFGGASPLPHAAKIAQAATANQAPPQEEIVFNTLFFQAKHKWSATASKRFPNSTGCRLQSTLAGHAARQPPRSRSAPLLALPLGTPTSAECRFLSGLLQQRAYLTCQLHWATRGPVTHCGSSRFPLGLRHAVERQNHRSP